MALDELGTEHRIQRPHPMTRMTLFGERAHFGSQVEMARTPESWADLKW